MNAPMLTRSQTPIHGVGSLAAMRGASMPVSAPNTTKTAMVASE